MISLRAVLNFRKASVVAFCVTAFLVGGFFPTALPSALAGGGPENVLVVVNEDSDSSKLIANHYIALRNIPDRNVVYLNRIPFKEATDFETFESRILRPVLRAIEDRELAGSIDYIVYSSDFPTSIRIPEIFKQFGDYVKAQGQDFEKTKKLYNPTASITSLTYLAGNCLHRPVDVMKLCLLYTSDAADE